MPESGVLLALAGGALIGAAVALFFLANGRIAGVSGILGDAIITPRRPGTLWRVLFVLGLALGYLLVRSIDPRLGAYALQTDWGGMILAGLLVGYGTRLGCGCTSGHGVCGIARLSPRSMAATAVFMGSAMLTVALLQRLGGQP